MDAMDNFTVHVVAQSNDALAMALKLGFMKDREAVGWAQDGEWLVFYWYKTDNCNLFPYKMAADDLISLVQKWLDKNPPKKEDYPNIDGSCSKGFEVKVEPYKVSYDILRVRSIWAMHHK